MGFAGIFRLVPTFGIGSARCLFGIESFMLNDLTYAFRQLFKSPAFTVVSILTIALGIGVTSTIFSVVNGVLLSPLPYANANRIVVLFEDIPNFKDGSISYRIFSTGNG